MKRLTALFLCFVLLASLTLPVYATDSVSMTVSGSKSTAYRGDTIDFSVSISTVEDCRSAAFMLVYDTSVFEFVSGRCTLSGTALASFSNGTGTFAYSTGTTVSGQIFTFTLRVKDSAPIGSATISANVNTRDSAGAIPTSVNSLTIKVQCNHSYGAWEKTDSTNHQRTCSICGAVETAAHTWDNGTVTKQPTCKDTGEKTYTCTTCGETKVETLAKTDDHSYGSWVTVDDNTHKHTCSVCGKEETSAHTFDSGKVTKQPTCKDTGEKTYNCTGCNHTKTETVPKTDNHSYSQWEKVDDNTHKHTCSVCGKEETSAHTWDSGKVTKQPNCKDTGEKTFTCTGCGHTKTETVAKTNDHSYGKWTKVDDNTHKHTCSVCSKEETASHTWDNGKVTKQPNCIETGEKVYTCTGCGHTKTETLPKTTTHNYGKWTKVDDNTHKHTCADCKKEETATHTWNKGVVTKSPTCKSEGVKTYTCTGCGHTKTEVVPKMTTHTYDHACDPDCNICGVKRTTSHSYESAWSKNQNGHWHKCAVCGEKNDEAAHVPGPEATETDAQTCTVCGYVIAPALGHEHSYAEEWTSDETGHWYACAGCEEPGSFAEHEFDNDCDPDCAVCGYAREIEHTYGTAWDTDGTNHWHTCTVCGEKSEAEAHTPGAEATVDNAQTCVVCDYELAPALIGETEVPTEDTAPGAPFGSFPWWIILIVIAVCGIVGYVIIKKKNQA